MRLSLALEDGARRGAQEITFGTPYDGGPVKCHYKSGGFDASVKENDQYGQMCHTSSFLAWLRDNAHNPQGAQATDWTLMGSYKDEWVSEDSAVAADGAHYWLYEYPEYRHNEYYGDRSALLDAKIEWWEAAGSGGAAETRRNDHFTWDGAPHFAYAALDSATLKGR